MPCRRLLHGETPPNGQNGYENCDNCRCCPGSSDTIRGGIEPRAGLNGPCPEYCISSCDIIYVVNCGTFGQVTTYLPGCYSFTTGCVIPEQPIPINEFCDGNTPKIPSNDILNSPYLVITDAGYVWRTPIKNCF